MMKYLARMYCEYTLQVEAENPEEAVRKAKDTETEDWQIAAWSDTEVEEDEN